MLLPGCTSLPSGTSMPEPYAHGYTADGATADSSDRNCSWARASGGMVSDTEDTNAWARRTGVTWSRSLSNGMTTGR
ncbi:hypothetical protein [Streptomyces sp. NPDC056491]|uniref:hypothetical protein n=1 Tax=Streptomyces sp. NPDC056491 TaxID=3345837 RepID=UPI0036C7C965